MSYQRYQRRLPAKNPGPRQNKYAGTCIVCTKDVPAEMGIVELRDGKWQVRHLPSHWVGSPISGGYADGCPIDPIDKDGKPLAVGTRVRINRLDPPFGSKHALSGEISSIAFDGRWVNVTDADSNTLRVPTSDTIVIP